MDTTAPDGGQRPLRDMTYFAADDGLHFSFEIPMAGDDAPAYVLAPELMSIMRYSADPRESVPVAFFKLSECGE